MSESAIPERSSDAVVKPQESGSRNGKDGEEHIFGGGPPARLWLPGDWFNFLADGSHTEAARRRYEELVEKLYPTMPNESRHAVVEGLIRWRDRMWSRGFLVHGVISVPDENDPSKADAFWQVVVATMKMPQTNSELNPGALLGRVIGQSELSYSTHVENFQTKLGLGMGFIGRPPLRLPWNAATTGKGSEPPNYGMAAAVSCAPGAEYGLAVVGVCLDPEQDRQLAMLVALIAGNSTLVTADPEPGGNGKADDGARVSPEQKDR